MTEEAPKSLDLVALAEWKARCMISPVKFHEKLNRNEPVDFEFSTRFRGHPWVETSIREGWDKELRGHLRYAIKRRILDGKPFHIIEDLMPDKKWIEAARSDAQRYALAAEWRGKQAPSADTQALAASVARLLKRTAP